MAKGYSVNAECADCEACNHIIESPDGEYVKTSDYAALEAERDRLREAINKIASGCQHTKRAKCLGHSTEINPWDFVYCNECCRIARKAKEERYGLSQLQKDDEGT
jgi:hypothetical protein